jgi:CubicO group peptidase (beta-lactamase class C family)
MQEFLQERVTDPIGMGEWNWYPEKDLGGIPINNGCTNVIVNAKQFARWGWLFLNMGNWDGNQLISKEWVKMATSVQVPSTLPMGETDRKETVGPGCYGFNWWINGRKANGEMKLPGAPEGCYFASGLNNNKCIVIPQWNMVVVRMGEDGHPDDKDVVYGTFLRMLGESIIDH